MSRPAGNMNLSTKSRLDELRRGVAAGMPEDQIQATMGLSAKPWRRLLQHHYASASPENNAQYMFRFAIRQADRYKLVASTISSVQGVRHPRAGEANPATGRPFPSWEKPPDVDKLCRIVRVLADLDAQTLDIGLRLGIYEEAPRRIELGGGVDVRMTDERAFAVYEEELRIAAKDLKVSAEALDGVLTGRRPLALGEVAASGGSLGGSRRALIVQRYRAKLLGGTNGKGTNGSGYGGGG